MTDDTDEQPPTAAAANDETTIVPPPTEAAPELAWSSEDSAAADATEPAPYVDQRSAWRWGVVVVAVALPLAAITAGAVILFGHRRSAVPAAPAPPPVPSTRGASTRQAPAPPAIAPLNGTYRIVLDYPHQTAGDVSNWHSDKPAVTMHWRFTTTCDNGCTAHDVRLNPDTGEPMPDVPGRQPNTVTLAYIDDAWRQPTPDTNGSVSCNDGTGARAQLSAMWQLTPEPDGTLRGTDTVSLPIGACGDNNGWTQTPMYAEKEPDPDAANR
jgi:serine/threonine-protein kinase